MSSFYNGITTDSAFFRKNASTVNTDQNGSFIFTNDSGDLVVKDANNKTLNISTDVINTANAVNFGTAASTNILIGAAGRTTTLQGTVVAPTPTAANHVATRQWVLDNAGDTTNVRNFGTAATGSVVVGNTGQSLTTYGNQNTTIGNTKIASRAPIINISGGDSGNAEINNNTFVNMLSYTSGTMTNVVNIGREAGLCEVWMGGGSSSLPIRIAEKSTGTQSVSIGSGGQTGDIVIGGGVAQNIFARGVLKLNENINRATGINTGTSTGDITIGNNNNKTIINSSKLTSSNSTFSIGYDTGSNDIAINSGLVGGSIKINNANGSAKVEIGVASSGNIDIGGQSNTGRIINIAGGGDEGSVFINKNNGAASTEINTGTTTGNIMMGNSNNNAILNFIETQINGTTTITGHTQINTAGLFETNINNDGNSSVYIKSNASGGVLLLGNPVNMSNRIIMSGTNLSIQGIPLGSGSTLYLDGNEKIVRQSSTRESKKDIEPFNTKYNSTSIINALEPSVYKFKFDNSESIGLIAEDVNLLLPEVCPKDSNNNPATIRYDLLTVVLIEEVKKLRKELDDLKLLL